MGCEFFREVKPRGDRFSRRENLMEKSEVSDTDAPAIRQAIHGSSLRALLFAVWRETSEKKCPTGREIYAGSNIRLTGANNRCAAARTPRMSFHVVLKNPTEFPRAWICRVEMFPARIVHTCRKRRAACPRRAV